MFRICLMTMFALSLTAASPAPGADGVHDGGVVVTNAETPADGVQPYELRELWRRGGEDDEELFFGTIAEFLHDGDGNVYMLDGQIAEVQVLDPDGEWLRTIGRQGEGPGEFQNGADMFWGFGDQIGVVQAWPGKIVMLTPDGAPGTTFSLPYRDGGGWQAVSRAAGHGDSVIMAGTAWTRDDGQQMQFTYLKSYDEGGNELATYCEDSRETQFGDYEFIEEEFTDFQRRWDVAPDGRVAAALSFDEYRIHVWNPDGSVNMVVERPDYPALTRTDDEMALFQTMYDSFTRWNRGSTFRVNPNHQAVERVAFRPDGTLWVQSGAGRWRPEDGVFTSFDVFDDRGRFQKRVDLIADADPVNDGLYMVGDRIYVVTDLLNAVMSNMGGGASAADATDAEPLAIVSYEFVVEL